MLTFDMSETSTEGAFFPTAPNKSYPFVGEYLGIDQLRSENEKGVYVNQGYAKNSTDGMILESEGFSKCSALLICNKDSEESYLAHIDDWSLSDDQYEKISELSPGKYDVVFVSGSISRVDSSTMVDPRITGFMKALKSGDKRKVESVSDVYVNSGDYNWGVSYDPNKNLIKVFTRKDKIIREYPTR